MRATGWAKCLRAKKGFAEGDGLDQVLENQEGVCRQKLKTSKGWLHLDPRPAPPRKTQLATGFGHDDHAFVYCVALTKEAPRVCACVRVVKAHAHGVPPT